MITKSSIVTSVGKIRDTNEDSYVFLGTAGSEQLHFEKTLTSTDPIQWYGVFDGMGGHSKGEVASRIAAQNVLEVSKNIQSVPSGKSSGFFMSVIKTLNNQVCDEIRKTKERIGSTATFLVIEDMYAHMVHIGDSSCFLFRNNTLKKLSTDHVDHYTKSELKKNKAKLTQYLGIFESEFLLEPEIGMIRVEPGDRFVLASDGLTDLVSEAELCDEMKECESIVKLRERLNHLYNERGAIDNMTLCIIQIEDASMLPEGWK